MARNSPMKGLAWSIRRLACSLWLVRIQIWVNWPIRSAPCALATPWPDCRARCKCGREATQAKRGDGGCCCCCRGCCRCCCDCVRADAATAARAPRASECGWLTLRDTVTNMTRRCVHNALWHISYLILDCMHYYIILDICITNPEF